MKGLVRKRVLPVMLSFMILCGVLLPSAASASTTEIPVVSYGLSVLSSRTDVAFSAMVGNDVTFTAEGFARGMNLSDVRYITVMSVPPITDGELLMGSSRIVAGQTLTAEQLLNVTFHPATESVMRSNFTFTANGGATPVIWSLYLMDEVNYTPTVSLASGLSLEVQTYRGVAAHGTLSAYDPDGDELVFEIVSYPQNGTLELIDATRGAYVYRPNSNYVGSDSFTYVARDRYGNYSASATVSLTVDYSGTSVTYADMADSQYYGAALKVTEQGIMSGTQVGNQYYFYPDQTVSRVEFLVMVMNAAGIRDVPECTVTVFADDGDIPEAMKGYVAMAHSLGIINGSEENGELKFLPNHSLTRAQAAVILENLLEPQNAPALTVFADHSAIPVWATDAMYSLNAAGIMTSTDGYIAPDTAVSRAQTAQMLKAVMAYLEN